jgi:hypothetical protein
MAILQASDCSYLMDPLNVWRLVESIVFFGLAAINSAIIGLVFLCSGCIGSIEASGGRGMSIQATH